MEVSQIAEKRSQGIKRVGVIGGGQLAWMMADAAKSLGVELIVQTPNETDPAVATTADRILAAIDDATATAELASRCEAITFENEFIDLEALQQLAGQGVLFQPSLDAIAPLLDKYSQRCYLRKLGLPTPQFWEWNLAENRQLPTSFPVVLKARRHGYDGQGTFIVKDEIQLKSLLEKLGNTPLLLEEFVPFDRELAVIAARSARGEVAIYPVVETQQENQVCRRVIAPAGVSGEVTKQAEAIARTLLEGLQVVGLFGIELFLTIDDKVLVNEIAPRTHNSGHFTIEACATSQFEQHLRAVCQLPLGRTELSCEGAVMVNLLGYESASSNYLDKRQQLAQIPGAFVHWYGKEQSRPGRKLGHVTVVQQERSPEIWRVQAQALAQTVESIWYPQ